MTHDDLLKMYYPSPTDSLPQYVTPAVPMPPQEQLPAFLNPQQQPTPQQVTQTGGGEGMGTVDIVKMIPTLLTIFGL